MTPCRARRFAGHDVPSRDPGYDGIERPRRLARLYQALQAGPVSIPGVQGTLGLLCTFATEAVWGRFDMDLAGVSVLPSLPKNLQGLLELALDLRWATDPEIIEIWPIVDATAWASSGNPIAVLQGAPRSRVRELGSDRTFTRLLQQKLDARTRRLESPGWFAERYSQDSLGLIAYFCMEFGLGEAFPMYAGGLGILAGDHLKACSDLGVPVVGIGLLYQRGYFRQVLSAFGSQVEIYPFSDPSQMPVIPARDDEGDWLSISVTLPQGEVALRVWEARVGRVRVYLLDTNHPVNCPADRGLAGELYGSGTETRLQQEIVLGIGGWRVLKKLGLEPDICHINEGHAAFAALERAHQLMQEESLGFTEALLATRAGNVFTTHTPVEAGFDRFPPGLIRQYLGEYIAELGMAQEEFLGMGRIDPKSEGEPFNMAYLGLRVCGAANAVSRLHAAVSRRLFAPAFPRTPLAEIPVGGVTNGVHVPSWLSPASDRFWKKWGGEDRWSDDGSGRLHALNASDEALWELRGSNRCRLVEAVRAHMARHRGDPWRVGGQGSSVDEILDRNTLTLGFARRFTGYKRCTLLLSDPDRLTEILCREDRPVQLVIAGKAHPSDDEGKAMIRAWAEFTRRVDVSRRVAFVVDYDMAIAASLVQGVDVWLNNPRRPLEASGTSGMKVLANGGLNLSELDGWWAEAHSPEFGWCIGEGIPDDCDAGRRDEAEADQLYRRLEDEVVPLFYRRDEQGIPRDWLRLVRSSMENLAPRFSAGRMVSEYVEDYYVPGARAYAARRGMPATFVSEMNRWKHTVMERLGGVVFESMRISSDPGSRTIEAMLRPNGLDAEFHSGSLLPEAYAEHEDDPDELCRVPLRLKERTDGGIVFVGETASQRPAEDFTLRVVSRHPLGLGALEMPVMVWADRPFGRD